MKLTIVFLLCSLLSQSEPVHGSIKFKIAGTYYWDTVYGSSRDLPVYDSSRLLVLSGKQSIATITQPFLFKDATEALQWKIWVNGEKQKGELTKWVIWPTRR